eukprot:1048438-Amphidinium_carterae.1
MATKDTRTPWKSRGKPVRKYGFRYRVTSSKITAVQQSPEVTVEAGTDPYNIPAAASGKKDLGQQNADAIPRHVWSNKKSNTRCKRSAPHSFNQGRMKKTICESRESQNEMF